MKGQVISRRERIGLAIMTAWLLASGGFLAIYAAANLGWRGVALAFVGALGIAAIPTGLLLGWLTVTCRKHEREESE